MDGTTISPTSHGVLATPRVKTVVPKKKGAGGGSFSKKLKAMLNKTPWGIMGSLCLLCTIIMCLVPLLIASALVITSLTPPITTAFYYRHASCTLLGATATRVFQTGWEYKRVYLVAPTGHKSEGRNITFTDLVHYPPEHESSDPVPCWYHGDNLIFSTPVTVWHIFFVSLFGAIILNIACVIFWANVDVVEEKLKDNGLPTTWSDLYYSLCCCCNGCSDRCPPKKDDNSYDRM